MSYPQFGYTYPSSSQILMTGNHPASATPCCQPASPVEPYSGSGPPQPAAAAQAAVCSLPAAYDSRLLSSFPRLAGLYASSASSYAAADPQGYVTAALAGTNPSAAFYSSLPNPYDLKESRGAWAPLPQGTATGCYPYDPAGLAAYGPYGDRYGSMDSVARRKNATRETTNTLKAWLYEHRKNPYPTKGEKIMLAIITKMTLTQVSTWFANARRRLKKENKMTWEPRNKSGETTDQDDKDDNCSSSSPAASDTGGKRSRDDHVNGVHDDDSSDLRVKSEAGSNPGDDRTKLPDFGSCAVKTESTGLASTGCLTANIGPYSGHAPQRMLGCSPNSAYRPQSPMSPGKSGHMPLLTPERMHPTQQHHHNHHFEDTRYLQQRHYHPRQGSPCSGTNMCDVTNAFHMDERPKIWSLAHTATSDSPPNLKRSGSLSHILPTTTGGEDYALNCGSPKESPAAVPPGTAGYACGGGLSSHQPPEQNDLVRRSTSWLNGDSVGSNSRSDCAQEHSAAGVAAECDDTKGQYSCYNGPVRRYDTSRNMYSSNVTKCYTGNTVAGPPPPPPPPPVFQSCLSPSNCGQSYKTTEHGVCSSSSSYVGGCGEVTSASSSSSSSPGATRPRSDVPSCDYIQPLVPPGRKPAPYMDDDKAANAAMSRTMSEFEPCEINAVTRGKTVQQDKTDVLGAENAPIPTQSCMAMIR